MIRALDRGVGRVLDALREQGLEENTLVFFTSDNGGAHYIGLPEVNRPFRGWKLTMFEGGIHVPFFVKWPARISPVLSTAAVHHFDIYATAAAAAGIPLPTDRKVDGVDLVPYLNGEEYGEPHEALFWRSGQYRAVRSDGWKLQLLDMPRRTWLFDLGSDPSEMTNQAGEQPQRLANLTRLLAEHEAEQAKPLWPSRGQLPVNIDKTLVEHDEPADEYIYWPN
jgi:arylsulfatase A-like enzyme